MQGSTLEARGAGQRREVCEASSGRLVWLSQGEGGRMGLGQNICSH